jgi:hypothetical protein
VTEYRARDVPITSFFDEMPSNEAFAGLSTDRLETKIDMSPSAVSARLREASDLYEACLALRAVTTPR